MPNPKNESTLGARSFGFLKVEQGEGKENLANAQRIQSVSRRFRGWMKPVWRECMSGGRDGVGLGCARRGLISLAQG